MDGGEFLMFGSYATVPKAKRGQPLDRFGWLVIGRRKRGLKVLTLTAKLLSVNIVLFAKKVRLKLFLLCACSPLKRMNNFSLFERNLVSLPLAILRSVCGAKVIASRLFFVKIPFGSLPALLLRNAAHSARVIVKMHSAMEFSRLKKPLLFALPLGILTLNHTNTGFY